MKCDLKTRFILFNRIKFSTARTPSISNLEPDNRTIQFGDSLFRGRGGGGGGGGGVADREAGFTH